MEGNKVEEGNKFQRPLELRRWAGERWAERSASGRRRPWVEVEADGVRDLGFRVGGAVPMPTGLEGWPPAAANPAAVPGCGQRGRWR